MEFTIIFKWLKDYGGYEEKALHAPSIISLMINLPLKEGKPDPERPLWGDGTS